MEEFIGRDSVLPVYGVDCFEVVRVIHTRCHVTGTSILFTSSLKGFLELCIENPVDVFISAQAR